MAPTPASAPLTWGIAPSALVSIPSNRSTASPDLADRGIRVDRPDLFVQFADNFIGGRGDLRRLAQRPEVESAGGRVALSTRTCRAASTPGVTTSVDTLSTPSAMMRTARKFSPTPGTISPMRQSGCAVGATADSSGCLEAIRDRPAGRRGDARRPRTGTRRGLRAASSRSARTDMASEYSEPRRESASDQEPSASSGHTITCTIHRRRRFGRARPWRQRVLGVEREDVGFGLCHEAPA